MWTRRPRRVQGIYADLSYDLGQLSIACCSISIQMGLGTYRIRSLPNLDTCWFILTGEAH